MIEKEKAQNDEIQTVKEHTIPQKPNNIMIKKLEEKLL